MELSQTCLYQPALSRQLRSQVFSVVIPAVPGSGHGPTGVCLCAELPAERCWSWEVGSRRAALTEIVIMAPGSWMHLEECKCFVDWEAATNHRHYGHTRLAGTHLSQACVFKPCETKREGTENVLTWAVRIITAAGCPRQLRVEDSGHGHLTAGPQRDPGPQEPHQPQCRPAFRGINPDSHAPNARRLGTTSKQNVQHNASDESAAAALRLAGCA